MLQSLEKADTGLRSDVVQLKDSHMDAAKFTRTLYRVTERVAAYYRIDAAAILLKSKQAQVVKARDSVIWILVSMGVGTDADLAERLDRSRWSIGRSCDRIEQRFRLEPSLKKDLQEIQAEAWRELGFGKVRPAPRN